MSAAVSNVAIPQSILDTDLYKVRMLVSSQESHPLLKAARTVDHAASGPASLSRRPFNISLHQSE